MHGDGKLPRPKLTFSNQNGNISMRLGVFKDFHKLQSYSELKLS